MIEKRITEPLEVRQSLTDTRVVIADGADWDTASVRVGEPGAYVSNVDVVYEGTVVPGMKWKSLAVVADDCQLVDVTQHGLNYTPRVHQSGFYFGRCKNLVLKKVRSFRTSMHFGFWFDGVESVFFDLIKSKYASMDGFKVDSKSGLSTQFVGYRMRTSHNGYQWGKPAGNVNADGSRWGEHFEQKQQPMNSDGVDFANLRESVLYDCQSYNNRDGGFVIKNVRGQFTINEDIRLWNVKAFRNRTNGIQLYGCSNCRVVGESRGNGANGVHVYGDRCFVDVKSHHNQRAGVSIETRCSDSIIYTGNVFRNGDNPADDNIVDFTKGGNDNVLVADYDELLEKLQGPK